MITSRQNSKIKKARELRSKRSRDDTGLTLVEGRRELNLAVLNKFEIISLFYCSELFDRADFDFLEKLTNNGVTDLYECDKHAYASLAYRESTEPFIAVIRQEKIDFSALSLPPNPMVLIAESLEKPGNLGALLRSADAAGVSAVIICDPVADLWSPNVVRASSGTIFTVRTVVADRNETLKFLLKTRLNLYAASPDAPQSYTETDFTGPTAILVGSEHEGLSVAGLQQNADLISIPMLG
ncbi:MAG: RNA methyltransferase, partial [Lentisphaerae bacterium]|nr:RNA methyltransferase [Lentisphaerota bacterium]